MSEAVVTPTAVCLQEIVRLAIGNDREESEDTDEYIDTAIDEEEM